MTSNWLVKDQFYTNLLRKSLLVPLLMLPICWTPGDHFLRSVLGFLSLAHRILSPLAATLLIVLAGLVHANISTACCILLFFCFVLFVCLHYWRLRFHSSRSGQAISELSRGMWFSHQLYKYSFSSIIQKWGHDKSIEISAKISSECSGSRPSAGPADWLATHSTLSSDRKL